MSEEQKSKKKYIPDVELEDGRSSKIADGVVEIEKGVINAAVDIVRTPIRAAGRMIDGAIQGTVQGSNQNPHPVGKVVTGVVGAVVGSVKGVVDGVVKTGEEIGKDIKQITKGFKDIGEAVTPTKKLKEESEQE